MPELCGRDGEPDWDAARLVLELVGAKGTDWVLAEWYSGGLAPLLERASTRDRLGDAEAELDAAVARAAAAEEHAAADAARAAAAEERAAAADERATAVEERAAAAETRAAAGEEAQVRLAAEVAQLDETLRAIFAGGWWRLRGRVLPAILLSQAVRRRLRR
jgi:hypothetical protein